MSPGTRKTLIWSLAALAAVAILMLLLSDWMTLAQLKARRAELIELIDARPVLYTGLLILAFAVIASIAPGAAVLKVAVGALYGLWVGMGVALASTLLAAIIGFTAARHGLRHWVERRFQARAESINRGVSQEGVVFLLALRLNPLIPFFLINLGMGLTRMRLSVFTLTSFFGLIPASFIYSNAGTELARIEAPSDILSVRLLGSLLLLSLMPIAGRWAAKWLRGRRGAIAALPGDG